MKNENVFFSWSKITLFSAALFATSVVFAEEEVSAEVAVEEASTIEVATVAEETTAEVAVEEVATVAEETTVEVAVEEVATVEVAVEEVATVAEETTVEVAVEEVATVEEETTIEVAVEEVATVEEETTVETATAVDVATEEVVAKETTTEESVIGPDAKTLIGYAEEIIDVIEDRLEWSDVPVIMDMSAKMLGHFSKLSIDMKRQSLIDVLNYVIDHTDTPWLPDRMTDPFFKAMVPPFAHIFISDDFLAEIDFSVPRGLVESKDFVGVADLIREKFADGFHWSDLTYTIGAAFSFGAQLDDMNWEERGQVMNDLVDYIVDKTDTPWMPDHFSDPVFKAFAHSTIQVMITSRMDKETAE